MLKEKEIFSHACDIDIIMDEINPILSGNIPEEDMWRFVSVLKYSQLR